MTASTDPEIQRSRLDAGALDALGERLMSVLEAGDCVTLSGPLGAGKSHLARAMIRARAGEPTLEVPSPSYTLVNVYDGDPEMWHADLYRLGDTSELLEIGLDDALETAILLIEWPERWVPPPPRRLAIVLAIESDETRALTATRHGHGWDPAIRALAA